MVSDFIIECHGYLCDDTSEARLYLETQHDGYFNNEMFFKQVESAQIFDLKFPGITGLYLFDNAPSHRKHPPDGLNADYECLSMWRTTSNERYSLEWKYTANGIA